jgi:hypothetical protein
VVQFHIILAVSVAPLLGLGQQQHVAGQLRILPTPGVKTGLSGQTERSRLHGSGETQRSRKPMCGGPE